VGPLDEGVAVVRFSRFRGILDRAGRDYFVKEIKTSFNLRKIIHALTLAREGTGRADEI
jgi:hypothetical protein